MTSVQTRSRLIGFGNASGAGNSEALKTMPKLAPVPTPGFGTSSSTWTSTSPGIWGSITGTNPRSNTLKANVTDENRTNGNHLFNDSNELLRGSSSLLLSSAGDDGQPLWAAETEPINSSTLLRPQSRTSPDHRLQTSQYNSQAFSETAQADHSRYALNGTPGLQTNGNHEPQPAFLDSTTREFLGTDDSFPLPSRAHFTRQTSWDDASSPSWLQHGDQSLSRNMRTSVANGNSNNGAASGYTNGAGSRAGSVPPLRKDSDLPLRSRGDIQDLSLARSGQPSTAQRRGAYPSANAAPFVMHNGLNGQRASGQPSPTSLDNLAGQMDCLDVSRRPSLASIQPHSPHSTSDAMSNMSFPRESQGLDMSDTWTSESQFGAPDRVSSASSVHGLSSASSRNYPDAFQPASANDHDPRLYQSSRYPDAGSQAMYGQTGLYMNSPSSVSTASSQAAVLERRLRNLQQQQQQHQQQVQQYRQQQSAYMMPSQMRHMPQFPYDPLRQQTLRMNQLSSYYPMPPAPHLRNNGYTPRAPAREHEVTGYARSPLLEEFRNNKTNRRYELKEIYHHIVEFSGDQHGSRFIQQKLETANSDEKEQVYQELHPNARQLMTDVFGNYVIQKFFEHGNQVQKKMLADQMRGHVLTLSNQMYGCRVVQKALEHILTDQQSLLIRELENDVMRCVKDQNGNHVVQKAIERVPAMHIQFIINAFIGKVGENAAHPYGCRVIQRMLEHCKEPTRSSVLQELYACASALINDQYGNYVIQHIIEHGAAEDRGRVVDLIISNLVIYSKHKFASNVVEKSIEFGSLQERGRIVQTLTLTNEHGESPVQSLIRDQYGNYVVQKLLTQLQGAEWHDFADPVKIQVDLLKRFSYGKQIVSIEKLLYSRDAMQHMMHQQHQQHQHSSELHAHSSTPTMHAAPVRLSPSSVPSVLDTAAATTATINSTTASSAAATPALTHDSSQSYSHSHSPGSSSYPSTNGGSMDVPVEDGKPPLELNGGDVRILTPVMQS